MIIPKLEDDEPSDEIKLNKFEAFMLEVMMTDEYDPSPPEHILAAFKVFDPEGKGYIDKEILKSISSLSWLSPNIFRFFISLRFNFWRICCSILF